MDEDVQLQIVDVNEPERESDEFEDGVCKKKETSLLKFTRYACTKSIVDRRPRI